MAIESWPAALAFVWRPENDGQGLHTDADDTGGATNRGVTHATWSAAVEHGLVAGRLVDAGDADLARVLKVDFWNKVRGDALAAGVDLAVFNLAMTAGAGRAALILQHVLGVAQDGDIGPLTLMAAAKMPAIDVIMAFTAGEESFYSRCPTAWKFLHGWDRRADDCLKEALKLAIS